jgi:hypothetical protein
MLVGTAFGGIEIWQVYAQFLRLFSQLTGMGGQSALLLYKFVDLSSFLQAVGGGRSTPEMAIFALASMLIGAALAVLLWKSARGSGPLQSLAWAVTITWTLLLNIYVPMYDSVLVVLAMVLTIGAVKELEWSAAVNWVGTLSVLTFAVSWVSYDVARDHRVQLLSIAFAIFGLVQLYILYRAIRQGALIKVPAISEA